MTTEYEALRRELHAEIDRRIDAAQPKEWPQMQDTVYCVTGRGLIESWAWLGPDSTAADYIAHGMAARTKAEAEAIRDRVSAFNKLWAASVADGGEPRDRDWCAPYVGGYPRARVWFRTVAARDAALDSLTAAERKALEG
jgi:hypothetical protein